MSACQYKSGLEIRRRDVVFIEKMMKQPSIARFHQLFRVCSTWFMHGSRGVDRLVHGYAMQAADFPSCLKWTCLNSTSKPHSFIPSNSGIIMACHFVHCVRVIGLLTLVETTSLYF